MGNLKPGDLVSVNGGPQMTVARVVEGKIFCRWTDEFGSSHERSFCWHQLKRVRDSEDDGE